MKKAILSPVFLSVLTLLLTGCVPGKASWEYLAQYGMQDVQLGDVEVVAENDAVDRFMPVCVYRIPVTGTRVQLQGAMRRKRRSCPPATEILTASDQICQFCSFLFCGMCYN